MDLNLTGRTALVTGGGQGVGRKICLDFGAEGANVIVNDLVEDRAKAVADEINAAGGAATGIACDVTDLKAVQAMVAQGHKAYGSVDILVNNAGIIPERRSGDVGLPLFHEQPPEHWRKIVELNFFGVANCVHAVLPGMIDNQFGKIVSIMSDAGRIGESRYVVYGGAKAGILGFSRSLAKEMGKFKINVNVVSLAAVSHEAPMADFLRLDATADTNETLAKILKNYPIGRGLGRLTRPQDAANAVLFLSSDAGEYITGQVVSVNGGYAMVG